MPTVELWTYIFSITRLDSEGHPNGGWVVQIPSIREAMSYAKTMGVKSTRRKAFIDGSPVDFTWRAKVKDSGDIFGICQSKRITVKVGLAS